MRIEYTGAEEVEGGAGQRCLGREGAWMGSGGRTIASPLSWWVRWESAPIPALYIHHEKCFCLSATAHLTPEALTKILFSPIV